MKRLTAIVAGLGLSIGLAVTTALPSDAAARRYGPFSSIERCEGTLAAVLDAGFTSGGCYEQDGQWYFKFW
ncbi:hypothetical protein AB0P21_39410 [Kribbella sp. NPDC056861]|uniref:hypothetical protein n=1 Tax=Kribbella sp. NPDC056861 TaxID=3154857 RepID=UPI003430E176